MNLDYVRRPISRVRPWQRATALVVLAVAVQAGLLTAAIGIQSRPLGLIALGTVAYGSLIAYGSRRPGVETPRLTGATLITVLRGTPAVVLTGFLAVGRPAGVLGWLPAVLFGATALLDAADGRVARATDTVSPLGDWLDNEVDSFAVLIAVLWAVQVGAVPAVFLLVGVARYVFGGARLLRTYRGRPTAPLDDYWFRRASGAVQMGVLFVVLTPVFSQTGSLLAVGWLVLVVWSFLRDWLIVTRRLAPADD